MAILLVGWTLFVLAHSYRLTVVPLAGGVAVLALVVRPLVARRPTRLLDLALMLSLTAIGLQTLPLPAGMRSWLAPAALAFERATQITPAAAGSPRFAASTVTAIS